MSDHKPRKKYHINDISYAFRCWMDFYQGERWKNLTKREREQIIGCSWRDFEDDLQDAVELRYKLRKERDAERSWDEFKHHVQDAMKHHDEKDTP